MNAVPDPLGEISVTDLSLLFGVFVLYQLFQIIVVQILLLPEVSQNVLHCYVPVIVGVKRKKGFSYTFPVV